MLHFYSIGLKYNMLAIIKVNPFLELIINHRIHMTVHEFFHMEPHHVLLANFYPVSDTWIVRIEIKSNISKYLLNFLYNNSAATSIP